MKVVISISAKLAFKPRYSGGETKTILYVLWANTQKKIDYLKYIVAWLCSSTTEELNIPYWSICLTDGFTF